MKKAVIFGLGSRYRMFKDDILNKYDVVAYADNDKNKIGTVIDGIIVTSPNMLKDVRYDVIIVTSGHICDAVYQLCELGISSECINLDYAMKRSVQIDDYPYTQLYRPTLSRSKVSDIIEKSYEENKAYVLDLLKIFVSYKQYFHLIPLEEPQNDPKSPYWLNSWLSKFDSMSIYSMIAHKKPRYYLECGSGNTTKFAAQAIKDHNLDTKIISIDPCPRAEIDSLCHEIIRKPLENVDPSFFSQFTDEDIFIVDNSHRAFPNSDVTVFFTEILPNLPQDMYYAIHDIFLPNDYPKIWIEEQKRYYNEQYMLATYLIGGAMGDKILLPLSFLSSKPECMQLLEQVWGENAPTNAVEEYCDFAFGGFFWMQKA